VFSSHGKYNGETFVELAISMTTKRYKKGIKEEELIDTNLQEKRFIFCRM